MNGKQSKKLRQCYRRNIRDQYKVIRKILKPKPKFIPTWLWIAGLKIFLKIK